MNVPVHHLKWTWLPGDREIGPLTIGLVSSDEPPSPEYIVVMIGTEDGFTEIARCDRFAAGALAKMQAIAEYTADVLKIAEMTYSQAAERSG